ncbi:MULTISPECIES: RagB/SusD family nutrient uptake outer membrane protein [Helicobacter]|nr:MULTISPECIES: RagB/SusD family nutrient uptake outer membrane protein [Helicobacter]MBD5165036.1 RagB/SusD family nutrient uptake outer membrane protein [Helicobacter sp.]
MKKIIIFLVCGILALSFSACGSKNIETTSPCACYEIVKMES